MVPAIAGAGGDLTGAAGAARVAIEPSSFNRVRVPPVGASDQVAGSFRFYLLVYYSPLLNC